MRILTGEQYTFEMQNSGISNENNEVVDRDVLEIIKEVREKGDEALLAYTARFDKLKLESLLVSEEEMIEARDTCR